MTVNDTTRFINVESGIHTLDLNGVRRELSTMSLPRVPSTAALAELGYAVVHPLAKPTDDEYVEDAPGKDKDGVYHQRWCLASAPQDSETKPYFENRLTRYHQRVDGQRERLLALGYKAEIKTDAYRIPLTPANRQYLTELLQWGLLQPQDGEHTVRLPCHEAVSFELPLAEAIVVVLDAQSWIRKLESACWVLHADLKRAGSLDDLPVIYDNSVESEMGRH